MSSHAVIYQSWAVANGLSGWLGTWKEHDLKIDDNEIWGKRYIARSLSMDEQCEDICVLCECSPQGDLSRGGF